MLNESNDATEVSFEDLVAMVGDDVDTLKEIVDSFLEDAPRLVQDIEKGLLNQDTQLSERSAHTIKSSSRLFKAASFAILCQQVEHASKKGDMEQVAKMLPELQQKFQILINTLTAKLEEL